MNSAKYFWQWFDENKHKYSNLEVPNREELLNEFLAKLHDFHPELYFQIGGKKGEWLEVVITAEGDVRHFEMVEQLVMNAPQIEGWRVTAFKPPEGFNFSVRYKDLVFDPSQLWFLPLGLKDNPDRIGIFVAFPDYRQAIHNDFLHGTFLLLDTCLGEKSAALDLDFVDVCPLPPDPEDSGMVEFVNVKRFIDWKKNRA